MSNQLARITYHAAIAKHHVAQVAHSAQEKVVEHKSELTCSAAVASVVYVASRAAGFKAGYAYAQAN